MVVGPNDMLMAYVYLDPSNPPSEVMLQWNDGTWLHRAYWGANNILLGTDGTNERRYMGALPAVGQWVRLQVPANYVGLGSQPVNGISFVLYDGRAWWDHAGKVANGAPGPTPTPTPTPTPQPTPTPNPPLPGDFIWVEDATPSDARLNGDREYWNWVISNPAPFSGRVAHQSNIDTGYHQHYFFDTTNTLTLNNGDKLFVYIYLDPNNVPGEVMLQFADTATGWTHRAYWGANTIALGTDGTESRRYIGLLPPAGQWTRLEVSASAVGLTGRSINGMAFTLFGGRATWDRAGKNTPPQGINPIDDAQTFVRAHYLDFLNREPDPGGWGYWSGVVTNCAAGDTACISAARVSVSAAFFIELEFQETGNFVYRFYKSSLGRRPTFAEFMPDRSQIVAGASLEATKQAFANAWVQRPEFLQRYPNSMSATSFIDTLLQTVAQNSGVDLSSLRPALISEWNDSGSRARLVRIVADSPAFEQAEYNSAFVLMQYFGYLRRDPDQGGYDFWLNVLNNRQPNNYRGMVCAFITSAEYQLRFGSIVTSTLR